VNSNVVFILSALALTAVAVAVLVWSLLRNRLSLGPLNGVHPTDNPQSNNQGNNQGNTQVYRQQLLDLEKEHAQGQISQASFEQTRVELLGRVLEDTSAVQDVAVGKSSRAGVSAMVLAVCLPVAAMLTYAGLGQPQGLDPQMAATEESQKLPDLNAMASALAHKLETDPENFQGWVMLGRTYSALNQFSKALSAYQTALALKKDDDIALERAEVLAQLQGGDFTGEPWAVIRQVLAKDARHFNGLLLAGSASYAQGDYKKTIQYWLQARSQLKDGAPELKDLDMALNEVREKAGVPALAANSPKAPASSLASAPASAAVISGSVSIDPGVKVQIAPTDVVFVYATPTNGQKMPLAIVRKTADQLPFKFVLDDSMAMNPASKLSAHTQVMLKVRISKSGEAMTRSGDWTGVLENVAVGSRNLKLVVNQQAP
jgi:cytochrome c-type biogenesis protein CcmH